MESPSEDPHYYSSSGDDDEELDAADIGRGISSDEEDDSDYECAETHLTVTMKRHRGTPDESATSADDDGTSEVQKAPTKKRRAKKDTQVLRGKKKKFAAKCLSGAPCSLESITGSSVLVVLDESKTKKGEPEKRNSALLNGIANVPNGFAWTDAVPPSSDKPPFLGPDAGPTKMKVGDREIDIFGSVTNLWVQQWMDCTNKHATAELGDEWEPITVAEGAAFLAAVLHMSIKKLPEVWMYWDDPEYRSEGIRATITRQRFYKIFHFTRLYDEDTAKLSGESDPNSVNYDPLHKVNAVWKAFILGSQQNKNATEDLVIDETVIPFKGRSRNRTLNPNKPGNRRNGLRIYTLADATGYVLNCLFYSPKPLLYDAKGRLLAVVFALLEGQGLEGGINMSGHNFFYVGHKLYCDNLYSDIAMIVALLEKDTYYCGTLRKGRGFLPTPLLLNKPSQYNGIKFDRGDYVFAYSSHHNLVFVNWKDNSHVMLISSLQHISNEIVSCWRKQMSKNKKWTRVNLPQPKIVQEYCSKMYYVDKGDQLLDSQRRYTKRFKWTLKVFEHVLHLSCSNSLILLRILQNHPQHTVLQFKQELIHQLRIVAMHHKKLPPTVKIANGRLQFGHRATEPLPQQLRGLYLNGHFAAILPERQRRKCPMHIHRKTTSTFCAACLQHLCSINCFLEWHCTNA